MTYACPVCGAACDKRCKGCLSVAYCSVEHQVGRVREDWKKHKGVCKALAAAAATAAPAEHGPEEGSEAFEAPARTAVSARALRTAVSARALFDVDVDVPAISR